MFLLGFDTETNGTEDGSEIIEYGAALYSVSSKEILQRISCLVPSKAPNTGDSYLVNKIPNEALAEAARLSSRQTFANALRSMARIASYVVAHNCQFDREMVENCPHVPTLDLPWIDTNDFPFPHRVRENASLTNLAEWHGITVYGSHRALRDVETMLALIKTIPDDQIHEVIRRAARPKRLFAARVEKPGTAAKMAGFRWNDPAYPYQWTKWLPEEDTLQLPFRCERVA